MLLTLSQYTNYVFNFTENTLINMKIFAYTKYQSLINMNVV